MRCLSLADALQRQGCECLFVCREHAGHLGNVIRQRNHEVRMLPSDKSYPSRILDVGDQPPHLAWLGAAWETDADQTAAYAEAAGAQLLIVDHYALDFRWESKVRPFFVRIMVIDDLADRSHDCDFLLDQNFLPSSKFRYANRVPHAARLLLGPRYALLRSEFSLQENVRSDIEQDSLPRLLIMFGGADRGRQTERLLRLLSSVDWQGRIDVVAGPLYPDAQALRKATDALPTAILHIAPGNIASLMRTADIALGAPGVSSLERCACALPSITVAHAWNQEAIGVALAEAGAHWYLGREADVTDAEWLDAIKVMARHIPIRRNMSRAAAEICDGRGADRTATHLLNAAMTVRKAEKSDGDLLFAWRNDERIRRLSRDPAPLEYQAHLNWLARTLENPDVELLLLGAAGCDMACIRFDCQNDSATLSIYVDPDLQGKGIGRGALLSGIAWLREKRPGLKKLFAVVLESNRASHQLFLSSGFSPAQTSYVLDL